MECATVDVVHRVGNARARARGHSRIHGARVRIDERGRARECQCNTNWVVWSDGVEGRTCAQHSLLRSLVSSRGRVSYGIFVGCQGCVAQSHVLGAIAGFRLSATGGGHFEEGPAPAGVRGSGQAIRAARTLVRRVAGCVENVGRQFIARVALHLHYETCAQGSGSFVSPSQVHAQVVGTYCIFQGTFPPLLPSGGGGLRVRRDCRCSAELAGHRGTFVVRRRGRDSAD